MMLGPKFTVDVSRVGAMAVVAPHGEVDLATVGAVRDALRPGEVSTRVVLDLRQVEFMDSAGLALIVEQMRRAEQDGFDFAVVRGPDQVQRLLHMAGLAERLVVLDDVPGGCDAGADR
jgi:anti-sigma B factor antagonist